MGQHAIPYFPAVWAGEENKAEFRDGGRGGGGVGVNVGSDVHTVCLIKNSK